MKYSFGLLDRHTNPEVKYLIQSVSFDIKPQNILQRERYWFIKTCSQFASIITCMRWFLPYFLTFKNHLLTQFFIDVKSPSKHLSTIKTNKTKWLLFAPGHGSFSLKEKGINMFENLEDQKHRQLVIPKEELAKEHCRFGSYVERC